jgi:hypothetical protein
MLSLDLKGLIGIYVAVADSDKAAASSVFRNLAIEGGFFTSPTMRCGVGRISTSQLKAKQQQTGQFTTELLTQVGIGFVLYGDIGLRILKSRVDYLASIELAPSTVDGIDCASLDEFGRLSTLRVAKLTAGALSRGHLPALELNGIEATVPGTPGRLHLDWVKIKSVDVSGWIAAIRNAGAGADMREWSTANVRQIMPVLDGMELSGLRIEIADADAPAGWESVSLASLNISFGDHDGGIPLRASVAVRHFKTNNRLGILRGVGVPVDRLSKIGQGDLDTSVLLALALNPAKGKLQVDASLDGIGLGKAKLSVELGGATEGLVIGDRETFQNLTLKRARLEAVDAGIVNLVLDELAREAGRDSPTFRLAAPNLALGAVIFALGATAETERLASALQAFIAGGKSLSVGVTAKAADGIRLRTIGELFQGHPTALGTELTIDAGAR